MEGGQHLGTGGKNKTKQKTHDTFSSCRLTEHHSKADWKRKKPTLPKDTSCQHIIAEGLEKRPQNQKIITSRKFYLMGAVKISILNHMHFLDLERQKDLGRSRSCHTSPSPLPWLSFPNHIHRFVQAPETGTPTATIRRVSAKASNVCRPGTGMENSLQAHPWQRWCRVKEPAKKIETNSKPSEVNESFVNALNGLGSSGLLGFTQVLKPSGF